MVTRHQLVGIGQLADAEDAIDDLQDLALGLARSVADNGRRTSLDDVLADFGHTRETLATVEDDE